MDKEHLEYNLKIIREHKNIPFEMSNEELADEQFPYIKKEFPNAQMIKSGIRQYVVVSVRARTILMKQLETRKWEYERVIMEISQAISDLVDGSDEN